MARKNTKYDKKKFAVLPLSDYQIINNIFEKYILSKFIVKWPMLPNSKQGFRTSYFQQVHPIVQSHY